MFHLFCYDRFTRDKITKLIPIFRHLKKRCNQSLQIISTLNKQCWVPSHFIPWIFTGNGIFRVLLDGFLWVLVYFATWIAANNIIFCILSAEALRVMRYFIYLLAPHETQTVLFYSCVNGATIFRYDFSFLRAIYYPMSIRAFSLHVGTDPVSIRYSRQFGLPTA